MSVTADQLRDLLALGLEGEKLAAVVAIFERDARHDDRHDASRSKEAIRAARYRQNRKHIQPSAKANDVAELTVTERDTRRDESVTQHCNLLSIQEGTSSEVGKENKKEDRAVVVERAQRATRMTRDAEISPEGREFALAHGLNPDRTWAEFVDHWIGVPGQRGTKLDWPATFRNRVRAIATRKEQHNGKRTVIQAADDLIDRVRSLDAPAPGYLRDGTRSPDVRLLPKG